MSHRATNRAHQLFTWAHALERWEQIVAAGVGLTDREAALAQLALLEQEVELAPGPGPRTKPAWAALADVLERRVREARTEAELAQVHADDLATYDWTLEEIETAIAGRDDLTPLQVLASLQLYRSADGGQVAWERHPTELDRWRWVAEDLSEGRGLAAPAESGWPAEPPAPGVPGPNPVVMEDGSLVDPTTGEVLGAALSRIEQAAPEEVSEAPPAEEQPDPAGGPDHTDGEVPEAPVGAEGPITPAPAGEPSEEDVAWADEIESLCNFACEIQQVEARAQAVKEAGACKSSEEVAVVRARIKATLESEQRVREQIGGKRYGHGPTRSEVQREKAAAKPPRGNAVARARGRLRGSHTPAAGPEADALRALCTALMAEVWPTPGTAPADLRSQIAEADLQGLERIRGQLERDVEAARARKAGALFGGGA